MATNNWTKDQLKAIERRDKNILVSASAGSGKTAVLVERIIQKILNEYLDVDKIMVVTFTNAAAQELKEKILTAIYNALEKEKDPKKVNHLRNQLIYINRASITTIDAFCFKLVKENFNILNVDPNIRICEESQSILIKTKVLEDLLEEKYESYVDEKNVFGLYNILELFNGKEDDFLDGILKIYNFIQAFPYPLAWLKEQIEKYNIDDNLDLYETDFGRDIYNDIISELELCVSKYDEKLSKILGIDEFDKCAILLEKDRNMISQCINIDSPSWDKLFSNLSVIEFARFNIGKVSDEQLKEEIANFRDKEVKDVIKKINKKIYATSKEILSDNKIAYKYITYLYDFIVSFDNAFKEEKKRVGVAEFNDIMHYALSLLIDEEGNLTDIAYALKSKYKEVYTDEYQDTSYVQERILDAVSNKNNRFMVGDIKQSIYGFRQARPDIFNDKYINYKIDEESTEDEESCKIILSKNFRSRHEVIDSINYIFEKIMTMKNGQCEYGIDESLKCGNTSYLEDSNLDYTTQINIIDLKDQKIDMFNTKDEEDYEIDEDLSSIQIEAKCIAFKIKEIVNNMKVSQKDGTLRKATYKDIVILLRSVKNKADIIEKALKENDIPVFCDTSSSIFEGDEVKLVLSFLKILDNPYQDIFLISIMYSIIGNFTLDEITKIRLYDSSSYVYDTLNYILEDKKFKEENSTIYEKIEDFLTLIKNYITYSKIYSTSDLLIRLYKDTNIYYQFALEENAESKKANLNYLIELATTFYSNIGNTLNAYIRYIDNLKDKQDSSTSGAKIIGENENVVRIMSIHKSKGLEFPIVIIADTAKKYNLKDAQSKKLISHYSYGMGIDIVNSDLGVTYPSLIKQAISSVITKETKSEEIRLLYVALTRAKEKLYIFATTKDYEKDLTTQLLNIKNGKFNETLIANATSYYKLILPVIKYYNEYEGDKKKLNINRIEIKSTTTDDELKKMMIQEDDEKIRKSANELIEELIRDKKAKASYDIINTLNDNLNGIYLYEEDVMSPSRISVSNLKKNKAQEDSMIVSKKIEDEENYILDDKIEKESEEKFKAPSFMCDDENNYTAVRKGLLIHFILQNLDFKNINTKNELKDYIQKLEENEVISSKDKKYISVNRIYSFLNSKIGKELKNAQKIYREYEFILEDKNISNSLIQGIIDLFYITDDGRVVLVDFKTDKLDIEEEYIKRYKIQLDIYKEAINKLTDYIVDKVYIYSFKLNKEIAIVEEQHEK